jgi:hypothetical protein
MAKFQVSGLCGRKIIVQDSKLNPGLVTITIESSDGSRFESITLLAVNANVFANAAEVESVNCHAVELKRAVAA